jgi:uncharacterized peroxidase-related enzyme
LPFIETIDEDAADGTLAELYAGARESEGYVPNTLRAFSLRPEVWTAWVQLKNTIAGGMDARRYELATLAAARELRSSYCSLAHGKILAERFLDAQTVSELAGGGAAGLDEAETATMDFAAKIARDACSITEDDVQRLRDAGLSDRDIFDVAVAASARCFFSKTLDAVGALPDAEFAELDPGLRDALTVGRPIEQRP